MRPTFYFKILSIAILAIILSLPMACVDSFAKQPPQRDEHFSQRVWIVVNLFNGRTSKQARLVRDTLDRLGAPGKGIVAPYAQMTVAKAQELNPIFLALSPNGIPWCRYKGKNGENLQNFFHDLKIMAEDMKIPVIGICGGHQAIALAFGGKVGPIRGGEDDCFPYGDNPTERGRHNVEALMDDPIFMGMGATLNMVQNHYDEVKRIPPGFITLAKNDLCPHQIIRHPTRPVYGVQAHSEYYFGARPDGGLLLRNFIRIATMYDKLKTLDPNIRPWLKSAASPGEKAKRMPLW